MKILTPAKINLFLKINNKRKDGYHLVSTLMQTISLYDEIVITPAKNNGIELQCNILPGEKNIAYRAAVELKKILKEKRGAMIKIKKNIPVGAGLGGGSSDAACVLVGLLNLWKKRISKDKLLQLTKELGADVTFFLYKGCCMANGIGEKISKLKPSWEKKPLWIVLVNPGISISTKKVYNLWDTASKDIKNNGLKFSYMNDLEPIVFNLYPELDKLKRLLLSLENVEYVSMSGSGSSVYAVFKNKNSARNAYCKLGLKHGYRKWLVKTVS